MLHQLPSEIELKVAKYFCPRIVQEYKDIRDFLCPVMLDTKENMLSILHEAIKHPTLYYKVSEDEEYIYAFFMTFHPFDWSDSKIALIRKLDEHLFDTESICIRRSKYTGHTNIATIYHHTIKRYDYDYDCGIDRFSHHDIFIESEGHGIMPVELADTPFKMVIDYRPDAIELVSLTKLLDSHHVCCVLENAGVDIPPKQANNGIMFLKPDVLFRDI